MRRTLTEGQEIFQNGHMTFIKAQKRGLENPAQEWDGNSIEKEQMSWWPGSGALQSEKGNFES